MPEKIYNKNAREKALLEEAYGNVYNLNEDIVPYQVPGKGKVKAGETVVRNAPKWLQLPGRAWRKLTGGSKPASPATKPTKPTKPALEKTPDEIAAKKQADVAAENMRISKRNVRHQRQADILKGVPGGLADVSRAVTWPFRRHPKKTAALLGGYGVNRYLQDTPWQKAAQLGGAAAGESVNTWDAMKRVYEKLPSWLKGGDGESPEGAPEGEESENIFDWHGLLDQLHEELETAFDTDIPKEKVAELFVTNALSTWVDNELVNENAENVFDWHGLLDQLHEELETAFDTDIPKEKVAELFATNVLMSWIAT